MENLSDFDFYLKFAKPLVLNLPNTNDKILAAAWIRKLIDDEAAKEEVKTAYLKLLLFVLQRKALIGPFKKHPNDIESLEEFPEGHDLVQIAKDLLEQEQIDLKEKIENRLKNDSGGDSYISDYSADYLEYVAVQHIENFGVHGYYALAKDPLSSWHRVDKKLMPKAAISTLDITVIPKSLGATFSTPEIPKGKDDSGATNADGSAKKKTVEIVEPSSASKKKKKRGAKRSVLGASPPVPPMGRVPSNEDREPPTWGSNLLKVQEHLMEDSGLGMTHRGGDTDTDATTAYDQDEDDQDYGDDGGQEVQDLWRSGGGAPTRGYTPSPPPSPYDYGSMDARGYTPSPPPQRRQPSPPQTPPPSRRSPSPAPMRAPSPTTLTAVKADDSQAAIQGLESSPGAEDEWDYDALAEIGLTKADMREISLEGLDLDLSDISVDIDEKDPDYYSDIESERKTVDQEDDQFSQLLRELEEKYADDLAEYGDDNQPAGDLQQIIDQIPDSSPGYRTPSPQQQQQKQITVIQKPKTRPISTRQAVLVSKEAKEILEEAEAMKEGDEGTKKSRQTQPGASKAAGRGQQSRVAPPTAAASRIRRPSLTQRTASSQIGRPTSQSRMKPISVPVVAPQQPPRRTSGLKPPGAPIPAMAAQQPQQQQRRRSSGSLKPPWKPTAQPGGYFQPPVKTSRRPSGLKPPGVPIGRQQQPPQQQQQQPQQRRRLSQDQEPGRPGYDDPDLANFEAMERQARHVPQSTMIGQQSRRRSSQDQPVYLTADAGRFGYDDPQLADFEAMERQAQHVPQSAQVRTLTAAPSSAKDTTVMELYNEVMRVADQQRRQEGAEGGRRQATGSARVSIVDDKIEMSRRDALDDYSGDDLEGDGERPRSPHLVDEDKALQVLKDITMASRDLAAASPAIRGGVPVTSPKPSISPLRLPNTDLMLESPPSPIKRTYRACSPRPSPPHRRGGRMQDVDLDMSFEIPEDADEFDPIQDEMARIRMTMDTSFSLPEIEDFKPEIKLLDSPQIGQAELDKKRARDFRMHVMQQQPQDYQYPYEQYVGGRRVAKGAGAQQATLSPVMDLPEHLTYRQAEMMQNVMQAPGQIERRPVNVVPGGGRRVKVPRHSAPPCLSPVQEPPHYPTTPLTTRPGTSPPPPPPPRPPMSDGRPRAKPKGKAVNRKRLTKRRLDFDQPKTPPPPRSPLVGPMPTSPPPQIQLSPDMMNSPPWPDYDMPAPAYPYERPSPSSPEYRDPFERPPRYTGMLDQVEPPDELYMSPPTPSTPRSRSPSPGGGRQQQQQQEQSPCGPCTPGQSPYRDLQGMLPGDDSDYMVEDQGQSPLYYSPPPTPYQPSPMSQPGVIEEVMEEVKKTSSKMTRKDMRQWHTGGKPGAQPLPNSYRGYYNQRGGQLEDVPEFQADYLLDEENTPPPGLPSPQGGELSPRQIMQMTPSPSPRRPLSPPHGYDRRTDQFDRPMELEDEPPDFNFSPTMPNVEEYRTPSSPQYEFDDGGYSDGGYLDEENLDNVLMSPLSENSDEEFERMERLYAQQDQMGGICPAAASRSPSSPTGSPREINQLKRDLAHPQYSGITKQPMMVAGKVMPMKYKYFYTRLKNVPEDEMEDLPEVEGLPPSPRTPPPRAHQRPTTRYVPPPRQQTPPPKERKKYPKRWMGRKKINFDRPQSPELPPISPTPQITLDYSPPSPKLPPTPQRWSPPRYEQQPVNEEEYFNQMADLARRHDSFEEQPPEDMFVCSPCCSGQNDSSYESEGLASPGELRRQVQQHQYTDDRGRNMNMYVGAQKRPLRGKQCPGMPDVQEQ